MKGFAPLPALAWGALLLGGALSYLVNTGVVASVPPDLTKMAPEMGSIVRNYEIEFPIEALGDLPPERFTFQSIAGPDGQEGRLFVSYYKRSRRWSGRPHDLDVCYRSMGYAERDTEVWQTPEGATLWSRIFENQERKVRVVHWLQTPGTLPGPVSLLDKLGRIGDSDGLRQDIASVYLEFELETAPDKEALVSASQAVIEDLDRLWR